MANFKGGFAFNNEAAKVEVEQSPNGALISCINPVTGESMGGGNPNSVQVITGTLANPFGDVNLAELITAFNTGGASIFIAIDATVIGQGVFPDAPMNWTSDYGLSITGVTGNTSELLRAALINWSSIDGTLTYAVMYTGASGTDIESYASQMPTTLTIYWHPMPETEGA